MPTTCLFVITIKDNSICQLRLDFESFELDGGSAINKPCDRDVVEIYSGRLTNLRRNSVARFLIRFTILIDFENISQNDLNTR